MGSREFSEYTEAVEWAKETDRELRPLGGALGTDIVATWESGKSRLEVHADYCEYVAEGETVRHDIHCTVKCYKVVVWESSSGECELDECDSRDEAFESFEKWKARLS